ncbi:phosphomannomutase [Mesorhizobium sp. Z1-4]|uniref:phosphomannomutase n=1 Tax=Mesorhizobium sp. Z1-4 TaxID=2448478 RepID=UPI000FD70460|nr:phosphomannomutase [Mesorhizobium sp. Z1-4]
MKDDELRFGTSGLRGLSRLLNGRPAAAYAQAFAHVMIAQGRAERGRRFLVGRDLRTSSPGIARFCFAGLLEAGVEPVDCGELPTPALAARAMKLGVPAIMVTGSHIPADRNGLKFYRPDGEIDKHDEAAIADAERAAELLENVAPANAESDHGVAVDEYRARAIGTLAPDALKGMRIGIYQHSSVTRDLLVDVLSALGADVVPFGRSDVFVPIDTEALSATDAAICGTAVREHRLDAVVSADADGDRPMIGNETGRLLRGDVIGALTASDMGAGSVVTPVTSNTGIERSGRFARVIRTRVGSPYVIEGMDIASAGGASTVVGFEANGGVLLGSDVFLAGRRIAALPTRDAMLPILAVLNMSKRAGAKISEVEAALKFNASKSGCIKDADFHMSAAFIREMAADGLFVSDMFRDVIEVSMINTTDGLQIIGKDGCIVHFRISGNAAELRCYTEANSDDRASFLLDEGLARARKYLGMT